MKKKAVSLIVCTAFVCGILTVFASATTIKIGSIAPKRSPWDDALRRLNQRWQEITKGQVELKIYPGSIAGNESDTLRKMRIGILGGGVFTNRGLTKIYSDIYVLNIPFLITSNSELDYVLEKMKPTFEKEIENNGFKIIIWSMAGWVHIFSKNKVLYPEDLKKHKLSFTTGEPVLEQAWKRSGYHIVPADLKDLMMALQSGMVDSFYITPLVAASGQYFPLAPHMCSLKIAPVVGGIVLTQKIWNQVPAQYKEKMLKAAQDISNQLNNERDELSAEAIETMKEHGLKINQVPENAVSGWKKTAEKGMNVLIGQVFSKEIYEQINQFLDEYEKLNEKREDPEETPSI
ncbi:MAG: C4-dicarboxylate ABC transporter substrate-binding protein [Candidatus Aminicenantes bacterium]|nr:C4-dicarboxylate ABC transporter substrate-binding protein [Candidatus Aminicenantes bacterium]